MKVVIVMMSATRGIRLVNDFGVQGAGLLQVHAWGQRLLWAA